MRRATVCSARSPWHDLHSTFARMCGAWLNFTCDSCGNPYTRCHGISTPFSEYAVTALISGLLVAIWLWQIMQVFTLGMPAIGPRSTVSWQSVHVAPFAIWTLCGNSSGWTGVGCVLKK